ncbi:hypothetical protein AGOR_G00250990 [Albula goreensis]|uniref:TNF family profile domain-containing protein n=1 Tax=Albula goreensis TaxID=1534307 RepID=A0A8T3CF16_9TELE|nr:hypothetical protein AGOR_G00250990 [Albula goreensis]
MKLDTLATRVCLLFIGMILLAVGILTGVAQLRSPPCDPTGTLNASTVAGFFQSNSIKASMFLKAKGSDESDMGLVKWANEEYPSQNATLSEDGHWIKLVKSGRYLLFVQAVYKVPEGGASETTAEDQIDLQLKVVLKHRQGSLEEYSSAFDTRHRRSEETDAVLNHLVLLQVRSEDSLAINASHRHLLEYNTNPVSTFLTLLKYADDPEA